MVSHRRPQHSNVTSSSRPLHRFRSQHPSRGRHVSHVILPLVHLYDLRPITIDPRSRIHQSLGSPVSSPSDLPAPSFHHCPSSLLHPRCLPPHYFAMLMPSAHRGLPHCPTNLRMTAPCRPLSGRPRLLRLHARPLRSTAPTPRQPTTPALVPSHRGMLPSLLPGSLITDPSLPPSFSTLSLSLPLGQPLQYSGLPSRSARPAPRDLQPPLGPFPPSSWSNAASLRAYNPDL